MNCIDCACAHSFVSLEFYLTRLCVADEGTETEATVADEEQEQGEQEEEQEETEAAEAPRKSSRRKIPSLLKVESELTDKGCDRNLTVDV